MEAPNHDSSEEEADFHKLKDCVFENSIEKRSWRKACLEWVIVHVFWCYDYTRCVCGHRIKERCVIFNHETSIQVIVGNVCINHFKNKDLVLPSMGSDIRKLYELEGNMNLPDNVLDVAVKLGIINEELAAAYLKYTTGKYSRSRYDLEKNNLSVEAGVIRLRINTQIALGFSVLRPRCDCDHGRTFARPAFSPKSGKYFYGCPNYVSTANRGCGFYKPAKSPF